MVWRSLLFGVVCALVAAPAAAGGRVVMYGAEWCGPCRVVKSYLAKLGVPFQYLDIDNAANRQQFEQVTGDRVGIPLVLVDQEKVRGARLAELKMILERRGFALRAAPIAAGSGEEIYGDHAVSWWQAQFAALRARVAEAKRRVAELDRVAVDHHERGVVLEAMKKDLKILEASLDDLEIDASRASLPRRYRAY